jgi:hypothetical protein|tara:strand:- start:127 stop:318 length:192 start_codon:yes stop_codon:yes gene_type:complete
MPIWLRKYTYSEIKNFYEEEKKQLDNTSSGGKGSKNLVNTDGKVNVPAFAEASKTYKGQTSYK